MVQMKLFTVLMSYLSPVSLYLLLWAPVWMILPVVGAERHLHGNTHLLKLIRGTINNCDSFEVLIYYVTIILLIKLQVYKIIY